MKSTRIGSLDLLKCAATTLIVFHHYQQTFHDIPGRHVFFFDGSFYFGSLVELFFLLSGFLIHKYEARIREGLPFRRFFCRRYLRVLPMMLLSTLLYALLSFAFFAPSFRLTGQLRGLLPVEQPSFWGVFVTVLGLQAGWGPANPHLNNPLWYISVLLACYLFFYLFVRLADRLGMSPLVFYAGMTLLGLSLAQNAYSLPFLSEEMGRGYYSFFPGLLLAAFWEKRRIDRRAVGLCLLILAGFLLSFRSEYSRALLAPGLPFLLALLVWPALVTLFLSPAFCRLFRLPWLSTLGAISFDIYIWHYCSILFAVILGESVGLNDFFFSIPGMLTVTLVTWLFGIFSYFCIEQPLARLTDRLLKTL